MEKLKITVSNSVTGATATRLFDAILEDQSNAGTVSNALQQWMGSLSGWIGKGLDEWHRLEHVSEISGITTARVRGRDDIRIVSELVNN